MLWFMRFFKPKGACKNLKKIKDAAEEQKGNFNNIYLGGYDVSTLYYYVSDRTCYSCNYSSLFEACKAANILKQQGERTVKFNSLARERLRNCDDIAMPECKKD